MKILFQIYLKFLAKMLRKKSSFLLTLLLLFEKIKLNDFSKIINKVKGITYGSSILVLMFSENSLISLSFNSSIGSNEERQLKGRSNPLFPSTSGKDVLNDLKHCLFGPIVIPYLLNNLNVRVFNFFHESISKFIIVD